MRDTSSLGQAGVLQSQHCVVSMQAGCLAYAVFCSLSRISDNKHHPSDVVAGSLLGAALALVAVWGGGGAGELGRPASRSSPPAICSEAADIEIELINISLSPQYKNIIPMLS